MEVMSTLGEVTMAEQCLRVLISWMKDYPDVVGHSQQLIQDGIRLLFNCGQAVRLSALHVYYSALPLTPKSLELFKCYSSKVPQVLTVISSRPTWPAATVRVLEGHIDSVYAVDFSPDGKKLVSGSLDNTLRLWDVESGQPIGDALIGHTNWIDHVTFSPDGKKLASASSDKTLWLWDVESGQSIGDALIGHIDNVDHVSFSPDGKKLVSASRDNTVRLWDVESGQPIGDALHDQTFDVVFSPDNMHTSMLRNDIFIHPHPTIDDMGFLCNWRSRLLWLPAELRGEISVHSSTFAIGSRNGSVIFVHIRN